MNADTINKTNAPNKETSPKGKKRKPLQMANPPVHHNTVSDERGNRRNKSGNRGGISANHLVQQLSDMDALSRSKDDTIKSLQLEVQTLNKRHEEDQSKVLIADECDSLLMASEIAKFEKNIIKHTKMVLHDGWMLAWAFAAICAMAAAVMVNWYGYWYPSLPIWLLSFGFFYALFLCKKTKDRRYHYRFLQWIRIDHRDLRGDTNSQGELKHTAKYCTFEFTDKVRLKTRTLYVSYELLAQITNARNASLRLNSEDAWKRIYSDATAFQSVNVARYFAACGINYVQDTAIVAHALYLQQAERRKCLPFPKPAP